MDTWIPVSEVSTCPCGYRDTAEHIYCCGECGNVIDSGGNPDPSTRGADGQVSIRAGSEGQQQEPKEGQPRPDADPRHEKTQLAGWVFSMMTVLSTTTGRAKRTKQPTDFSWTTVAQLLLHRQQVSWRNLSAYREAPIPSGGERWNQEEQLRLQHKGSRARNR